MHTTAAMMTRSAKSRKRAKADEVASGSDIESLENEIDIEAGCRSHIAYFTVYEWALTLRIIWLARKKVLGYSSNKLNLFERETMD
jgi:hypothetical protein